ncbi:hypothetical protein [Burkholderia lata]|uniref:hypothetical protein n=1 Tax=Burkholderia lata (strain ATCC 17760 / DSM 23089 / LMG 22485 / NCIMB 9086 / R18194 / 383) TaxID=482957 RepID=UPI001454381E|nr:hypothetical protein [Burkholderia lata]VWB13367.1 hypothetical protein BLA15816_00459 [Burkholderia lata]
MHMHTVNGGIVRGIGGQGVWKGGTTRPAVAAGRLRERNDRRGRRHDQVTARANVHSHPFVRQGGLIAVPRQGGAPDPDDGLATIVATTSVAPKHDVLPTAFATRASRTLSMTEVQGESARYNRLID